METTKVVHRLAVAATWVCFVIGAGLLCCGIGFYRHSRSFLAGCARADGTVVANISGQSGDGGSTVYYPKFSFQTPDGQTHTISSTSGSAPPSYSIGQHVPVLYTPGEPDSARLNSFMDLWFAATIFSVLGIAGWIGWIFWWIVDRKFIVPKLQS